MRTLKKVRDGMPKAKMPAEVEGLVKDFEEWRSKKIGRGVIPIELWERSSDLAEEFGISYISRVARLDHKVLGKKMKERKRAALSGAVGARSRPVFMELNRAGCFNGFSQGGGDYFALEMEDGAGRKMKVCIRGKKVEERLDQLSRIFFVEGK